MEIISKEKWRENKNYSFVWRTGFVVVDVVASDNDLIFICDRTAIQTANYESMKL